MVICVSLNYVVIFLEYNSDIEITDHVSWVTFQLVTL
jgi:hypothetical protein